MPEFFPNFVVSREEFLRAKAFWSRIAAEEASALGQEGEWGRWLHEEEWRNDPELMDGALVCSLYSASQNKGFRVQQSAISVQDDKKPYVNSWTAVFGENFIERPIPNLFIGAIPTDENLPLLRRLIRHWFDTTVDQDAMQAFVDAEVYGKRD